MLLSTPHPNIYYSYETGLQIAIFHQKFSKKGRIHEKNMLYHIIARVGSASDARLTTKTLTHGSATVARVIKKPEPVHLCHPITP